MTRRKQRLEAKSLDCMDLVLPVYYEITGLSDGITGSKTFIENGSVVINFQSGSADESLKDTAPDPVEVTTEGNGDSTDNSSTQTSSKAEVSKDTTPDPLEVTPEENGVSMVNSSPQAGSKEVKKNRKRKEDKIKVRRCKKWKSFVCAVCKAEFGNEDEFHTHVNDLHTAEYPFPCDRCKKRFAEAIQLKTHQSTHDPNRYEGEPQFQCEFCDKKYHLKVSLATHRNLKHLGYKRPPKKSVKESLKMTLPRNKGVFGIKRRSRTAGQTKRTGNAKRAWKPISREYFTEDNTTMSQFSESIIQLPKIVRPCFCKSCDIILPSQLDFQLHLNSVHADSRIFPCRHCGKRFATFRSLLVHETIHNPCRFQGEPIFGCDLCDKKFHLKNSLYSHQKYTHGGHSRPPAYIKDQLLTSHHSIGVRRPPPERPVYPCPECDLTFPARYELTRHLKRHQSDKPFNCEICGQCFANSSSVHAHRRNVHENPSPYNRRLMPAFMYKQMSSWDCETCGRQFRLPSQLRVHIRLHTGERPYQCITCGERFRIFEGLKSHWKSHLKTVSPFNSFKCLVCGMEGFKRFSDFGKHRRRKHPEIPYRNEKEKAFACGVCEKPYFLRENAVICAILKHDPTRLHDFMFKHKCPECPPERFGHRNLLVLRDHWKMEHGDKPIPAKLRAGMYNENIKDTLPTVILDKAKAQEIKEKDIPPNCKYDYPLFVEFNLMELPSSLEDQVEYKCRLCDKILKNAETLSKHIRLVHGDKKKSAKKLFSECSLCGLKFSNVQNMQRHLKSQQHQANMVKGDAQKISRPASSSRLGSRIKPGIAEMMKKAFQTAQLIKPKQEENVEIQNGDVKESDQDSCSSVPQTYALRIVESEITNDNRNGVADIFGEVNISTSQDKLGEIETEFKPVVEKLPLESSSANPVVDNPSPQPQPTEIRKRSMPQKVRPPMKKKPIFDCDPVKCDICEQPFANKSGLAKHFTTFHRGKDENQHEPGLRPSLLPRSLYNPAKSFDCEECGRQFKMASTLRAHRRLHTGERPFKCSVCGEKIRMTEYLREHFKNVHQNGNTTPHLNIYKCRVCGKEGFHGISNFSTHRKIVHADVPYQDNKEKAFGCGICRKPYFLRENAAICAILRHDPSSLQQKMFKVKCPECPPDWLGHRNLLALNKHWKEEHGDKQIPSKYRFGLYDENLQEVLPTVTVDKTQANELLKDKIPSEKDLGYAPFVDFGLFDKSEKVVPRYAPKTRVGRRCSICNKVLSDKSTLNRHMRNVHGKGGPRKKETRGECTVCGLKYNRARYLKVHLRTELHRTNVAKMEKQDKKQVKGNISVDTLKIPIKSEPKDNLEMSEGSGGAESESIEVSEVFILKIKEEPETGIPTIAGPESLEMGNGRVNDFNDTSSIASQMKEMLREIKSNAKPTNNLMVSREETGHSGAKVIRTEGRSKKKRKIPKNCSICGLILSSSYALKRHTTNKHPDNDLFEDDISKENVTVKVKNPLCPVIISVSSEASEMEEKAKDIGIKDMNHQNSFETGGKEECPVAVVVKQEIEEYMDDQVIMDGFCEVGNVEVKVERLENEESILNCEETVNTSSIETTKDVLTGYEPPTNILTSQNPKEDPSPLNPLPKRGRGRPRKHTGGKFHNSNGKFGMPNPSQMNARNALLGAKRKPGRPFGSLGKRSGFIGKSIHRVDSNGHQSMVQREQRLPNIDTDDSKDNNNSCFICGFKATSVSILRRHVIAEHIDAGDSHGESEAINRKTPEIYIITETPKGSHGESKGSSTEVSNPGNLTSPLIKTFDVNDMDQVKFALGNRECRLILTRVDDDAFDFSNFINLRIC